MIEWLPLTDELELLAERVFLCRQRHELLMPEPDALRLRQRGHCMDDGYFALCHVVDLTDQVDDLRHLLPNLRVMPASVTLRVENTSFAVSLGPADTNR